MPRYPSPAFSQMTPARRQLGRAGRDFTLPPFPTQRLGGRLQAHCMLQAGHPRGHQPQEPLLNLGKVGFASRQASVPQQTPCAHPCASAHLQLGATSPAQVSPHLLRQQWGIPLSRRSAVALQNVYLISQVRFSLISLFVKVFV